MACEAFSLEEIQRFQEMGLGRGIDGTSSQPWRNKTSFQVRDVRSDNVILTDEGGVMQSYEHEISSVQTMQAKAKASVVVPQSPVTIGVEGEMSRSVSTTRIAVGKKVTNRTVSFRSNFQDVPLSHMCDADLARRSSVSIVSMQQKKEVNGGSARFGFEEQLAEWILLRIQQNREQEAIARKLGKGSGSATSALVPPTNTSQEPLAVLAEVVQSGGDNEVQVVMHACLDFVRHFRITHYVCGIEIGAAEYKVMTETDYRTEMGIAGTLGVDKVAAAALSGKLTLQGKSKSTDLRRIGSIQEDGQVERGSSAEAVVGVKILPITNLVSLRFLQLALQKAVLEFLEVRSDKSGEFRILPGCALHSYIG